MPPVISLLALDGLGCSERSEHPFRGVTKGDSLPSQAPNRRRLAQQNAGVLRARAKLVPHRAVRRRASRRCWRREGGPARLRQSVAAAGLAIAEEAEQAEAERHHRPRRRFGDSGADFEREILVGPLPPRPFILAGGRAEGAEGLAGVGRSVRQGAVGEVALWHDKFVDAAEDADG